MMMLNIEIHETPKMSFTGSSVLRALQNNSMPHVDLLVRESIQNSLDASKNNGLPVGVSFNVGRFDNREFSQLLEGVGDDLLERYGSQSSFLSVRDQNTEGLTGPLPDEIVEENNGNLNKLIYQLSKPQEREGSGGSWGYGKTIFYRIGMGMVIYYTRIEENGVFKERLAIAHVENEKSKNNLIPYPKGFGKTGIAWWGELYDNNRTKPITDSILIGKVLDAFGITPYKGEQTGTTVIVPYINEQELLNHNRPEHSSNKWYSSLSDYLSISIQRWYAPRLNNIHYSNGSKSSLLAYVNGNQVIEDNESVFFEYLTEMYNYAVSFGRITTPLIDKNSIKLYRQDIRINTPKMKVPEVGCLVFAKFTYKDLGLMNEFAIAKPSFLANKIDYEISDQDQNKPLLAFTRKPGMIVSYETSGEWLNKVPSTGPGEYIFGIFVLNSDNIIYLNNSKYSLEEYIRGGEQADHTSWSDHQIVKQNMDIVKKIQSHCRTKMANEFKEIDEEIIDITAATSFGKYIGDKIMPRTGFGTRPNRGSRRPIDPIDPTHTTSFGSVKIVEKNKRFVNQGLAVPFEIKVNKPGNLLFELNLEIKQDGGSMSISKFEADMKTTSPLSFNNITIIDKKGLKPGEDLICKYLVTNANTISTYRMYLDGRKGMTILGEVFIHTSNVLFTPVIKASLKEHKNV